MMKMELNLGWESIELFLSCLKPSPDPKQESENTKLKDMLEFCFRAFHSYRCFPPLSTDSASGFMILDIG
jgi:hypothetical protein